VVGQVERLVASPGLKRGDELHLIDQAVLQSEQSEQEVAVSVGGHERASRPRRGVRSIPRQPPGYRGLIRNARRTDRIIA